MINITEENNQNLYYNVDDCIRYCNEIKETEYSGFTYFHSYWNVGLPFGRKQILLIKSYIATQNLKNTKFVLWSNVDLSNNEFLKPYLKYVDFRIYDPIKESIGTVLENRNNILTANDSMNWAAGDLFRILTLHNYGGVYCDGDVVLLRDFAPLLESEFLYKWGNERYMINGAVMRMFKKSKLSCDLLSELIKSGIIVSSPSINWGCNLYQKVRNYNTDWVIYPSGFFNSEWEDERYYRKNNRLIFEAFKRSDNIDLYNGAFSWHWHNRWNHEIESGSKWELVEKIIEEKLTKIINKENEIF
jgi:hypothetical protein